jgi:hypothetical protein
MRTTVTLDADAESLIRREMAERHVPFKVALNDAIRRGLAPPAPAGEPFRTPTASLGTPGINLDRALQLAGQIEDDELLRKQRVGK